MSASDLEKARARCKVARHKRQLAEDEDLEARIKLMIAEERFTDGTAVIADAEKIDDKKPSKKSTTKKREKDEEDEEEEEEEAAPTKKASTKPAKQAPADFKCPGNVALDLECEIENSLAYHKQVQNPKTKKLIWACSTCRDQIIAAKKAANAAAKKLAKKQAAETAKTAVVESEAPQGGDEVEAEQ